MNCPICGRATTAAGYHRGTLRVMRCPECSFLAADLDMWTYPYVEADYYPPAAVVESLKSPMHVQHRVATLLRHVPEGRVVDLGCGMGETAIAMKASGLVAEGVDESANAIRHLRQHHPEIGWHNCGLTEFLTRADAGTYEAATMYHVLEHLPNPIAFTGAIRRILKPEGVLAIEVPDVGGRMARRDGWNWRYWLPHHVNYFTRSTLALLMEKSGFTCIGSERKYHQRYPQGIWWKDAAHRFLAAAGWNHILVMYWRRK